MPYGKNPSVPAIIIVVIVMVPVAMVVAMVPYPVAAIFRRCRIQIHQAGEDRDA
jgi:hypothetical protein